MANSNIDCAKCKSRMEEGMRLDMSHTSVYRELWISDAASGFDETQVSRLFWFKSPTGKAHGVKTYRCTKCGYLESYAK